VNTAQDAIFYTNVVEVTHKYLGPAADRFVARQVRNHLGKEPEELKKQELAGLIEWFTLAMAILSDDKQLVQRYAADLRKLVTY
jgi:hypothetical protein